MPSELVVDFPQSQQSRRLSLLLPCDDDENDVGQASSRVACNSISFVDLRNRLTRRHGQPNNMRRCSHSPESKSTVATKSVRFSETSWVTVFAKHGDREGVCYNDLWYTQSDIERMKIAAVHDTLEVNNQIAAGVSIDRLIEMEQNANLESSTICLAGIESRLTQLATNEVRACRARCVLAVLREQERQQQIMSLPSLFEDRYRSDMIALASLSQTTKSALRARTIGLLHQKYVDTSRRLQECHRSIDVT